MQMVPYPIAMLDHFYAMPFLTYLCQSADTSSNKFPNQTARKLNDNTLGSPSKQESYIT